MMVPEVAEELYRSLKQSMREDGERLLDRTQSLLPPHAGPTTKLLQLGSPTEVIITTAEAKKVDLIIMGARGLGPIKERLIGSVSHRILTLAPCATLIVNGPVKAMKQILLPLQGSFDETAAIRFLQLKPFHDPVELTLLTVLSQTQPPWPVEVTVARKLEEQALQIAHDYIDEVAKRLRTIGYQARGLAVLGTPSSRILQEATARRSDLILMGTKGRQGITRFMLGSTSHAVLHKMPCPVLAFH